MEASRLAQAMAIISDFVNCYPQLIQINAAELELLRSPDEAQLQQWTEAIEKSGFTPQTATLYDIPKRRGGLRPCHRLSINDRIYYNVLLIECLPMLFNRCHGLRTQEICEPVQAFIAGSLTTYTGVSGMKEYLGYVDRTYTEYKFELRTDIAAFYPQLSHAMLSQSLLQAGISRELISKIMHALSVWMGSNVNGIPQTYWASDLLAESVLQEIDRALINRNVVHSRISDNIRIYCHNEAEAPELMKLLEGILEDKGLVLNTSKTQLLTVARTKRRFYGLRRLFIGLRRGGSKRLDRDR